MMSLNIGNCPRCGKVFAKGMKDVCPACSKEIDAEYELCAQYLRDNRGANIHQVSEDTEVTVKQITKFIREGRISLMDAPNMGIPCDACGSLIREGIICDTCRQRLSGEMKKATEANSLKEEQERKQAAQSSYRIRDDKDSKR